MRKYGLLFLLLVFTAPLFAQADIENTLQSLTRQTVQRQAARVNRFGLMRYFPPSDTVQSAPSWWDNLWTDYTSSHERALAFYLFNMYASTRVYNSKSVSQLTLNFLGTLDAFYMQDNPFPIKEAQTFYQKHKKEVQTLLADYFKHSKLGVYRPNETLELSFVRALTSTPLYHKKPAYTKAAVNLLKGPISEDDEYLLESMWRRANNKIALKVVTFEQNVPVLDAYDTKLARPTTQKAYFYRWVQDECNYSSYMVGKELTETYLKNKAAWGHLRIYMLTARPKTGEYLAPAAGNRFTLANGKTALKWQYHTALLAVTNFTPGHYTPFVLDSFLGGEDVMTLDEWLSKFSSNTVFLAEPFFLDEAVEKAIQEATRIDNNDNIYINGKTYAPAPVEN